jgi:hypothetical protein
MSEEALRIASLCIVLAGAETLHGIARAALLVPRIGKKEAQKVAIITGSALAFGVCYFLVPGIGYSRTGELFGLGLLIALFMSGFDIALAKFLLKRPWRKVLEDFDPRTGNYLLYGVMLLASFPYLVMQLK